MSDAGGPPAPSPPATGPAAGNPPAGGGARAGAASTPGSARRAAGLRWRQWAARRLPVLPPSTPPGPLAAKAAFLRQLELDVTRRLDGMISGDYVALATGPGTEPVGARPYGPGDDARRIDWNLTARALAPHVRTTEPDRELETWIVVDRSASLDFGTALREKREVALAAVAAFGFLSIRAGNRLGVLVAGGDQLIRLQARSGRTAVLAALSLVYDTPRHESGPATGADIAAALAQVARTHHRRGRVVVISDFLDAADWATPFRRLALRHQVVAAQVSDPREFALPAVGMLEVVDAESGARMHVQTNSAELRARYAAAVAERHQQIHRLLAEAGVDHVELSTDRDWLVDVARFLRRRRGTPPLGGARLSRDYRATTRRATGADAHPAGSARTWAASAVTPPVGPPVAAAPTHRFTVSPGGYRP